VAEKKSSSDEKDSPSGAEPVIPKPPVIKPRKAFVAKKITAPTDKPMEHRVRHIRLSAKDSADLFWQTAVDFQKELADQPTDDPDKEFADREKVEAFFVRLAKKYSICPSHALGGELGWISPGMNEQENIPKELISEVLKGKRFVIPEPIKTPLGFHIVLICESRVCKKAMEEKSKLDPRYEALAGKDRPEARAPTRGDIPT
jgi:hypothetical protein